MTTLEKIYRVAVELATYEPCNRLLAIYIKSILNDPFFMRYNFKL